MGSSRLQQVANVLKVPVSFFFEGAPGQQKTNDKNAPAGVLIDFLSTADGSALMRGFMRLPKGGLRRSIVTLVEAIADDE